MSAFSFVHAADLHLDSPFVGLGRLPEGQSQVIEALREATFRAFDAVIDLCIREQVDFLLVAGDVYDGADRSLKAQLRFRDGLRRLNETARHGFAYGTLPSHVESGEERFTVEWNQSDDSVWYDILAFSRPNYVIARLGYPVVRLTQKRFARDSAAAMLKAVSQVLTR